MGNSFFILSRPSMTVKIHYNTQLWPSSCDIIPTCFARSHQTKDVERVVRLRTHRKRTLQRLAFHLCPGALVALGRFHESRLLEGVEQSSSVDFALLL